MGCFRKPVRWSYLFSSRKINQPNKNCWEIPGNAAGRADQNLHCMAITTSRSGVNASCSSGVLFHLLQLPVMALSCCSVYTNLSVIISVEIWIFSLFPLRTAEHHSKEEGEKNKKKKGTLVIFICTQQQMLKVF